MARNKELSYVDELIAVLSGNDTGSQSAGRCGLILEHLRAARTSCLGTMHNEYGLSLEQAMESTSGILEKRTRIKTRQMLQSLIDLSVLEPIPHEAL
jgi:hypothetical protein